MELRTLEEQIKPILKEQPQTRADDMLLYTFYCLNIKGLKPKQMLDVFIDRQFRVVRGIAQYESISRVRRRLQEKDEALRPSKEYLEARKEKEKEFKAYSLTSK